MYIKYTSTFLTIYVIYGIGAGRGEQFFKMSYAVAFRLFFGEFVELALSNFLFSLPTFVPAPETRAQKKAVFVEE